MLTDRAFCNEKNRRLLSGFFQRGKNLCESQRLLQSVDRFVVYIIYQMKKKSIYLCNILLFEYNIIIKAKKYIQY